MARFDLTDEEWSIIEPLLPGAEGNGEGTNRGAPRGAERGAGQRLTRALGPGPGVSTSGSGGGSLNERRGVELDVEIVE